MNLPKLTIVTPSFNQARFLEATLCSVLDQNYPNLEYIVIDGGSTDGSADIIKRYASKLAYSVSEPDGGQSHALNKGFARATGDIFGFINSDDTLYPGSLHTIANAWLKGNSWLVGLVDILELDGSHSIQAPQAIDSPSDWFITNPIPQQASFWSGRYNKELGPFREDLHYVFDYEFWMRLHFTGGIKPLLLPQCLASYRMQPESKTVAQTTAFDPEFRKVRKQYAGIFSSAERRRVFRMARRRDWMWHHRLGWQALKSTRIPEARSHAVAALRNAALDRESWRLFYCAMRGH